MKTAAVLSLGLASLASAQPFVHQHRHRAHVKRADVVYTTEWDTVVVTEWIDYTTTTWVTPGVTPVTTTTTAAAVTTSSSSSPSSSSTDVPAQFLESTTTPATTTKLTSTVTIGRATTTSPTTLVSVYVTPSTSTTETPTTTSTTSTTPVTTAAAAETTTSTTPEAVAAVATTTSTTAAAAATTSSSSSGTTYSGDMTYYILGKGSCGIDDTGLDLTTNIVAINHVQMGELANDNPMCGKTITISQGGVTTTALIHDKCMGCVYGEIDVSESVFDTIFGSTDLGRSTVTWWFNE